jgi:ZIP family zinc transporter
MSFFPDFISWIPAVVGLILGGLFLVCLNDFIERKNINNGSNMLMFSVTLHNIPEGMAVGVCLAGALSSNSGITLVSALILSLGIAIQNIPEGAIISMPSYSNGNSKKRAFFTGVLVFDEIYLIHSSTVSFSGKAKSFKKYSLFSICAFPLPKGW